MNHCLLGTKRMDVATVLGATVWGESNLRNHEIFPFEIDAGSGYAIPQRPGK
jgi:hypothetical protein